MKTISLLQPWASLVAIGAKKIETRSWHTSYRGPLAIHASKGFPKELKELSQRYPFAGPLYGDVDLTAVLRGELDLPSTLPLGAVIATCNLVDCKLITGTSSMNREIIGALLDGFSTVKGNEYVFGDFTPGRYAWILEDVKPLPAPIPAKGMLGLWEWTPPDGVRL